MAKTSACETPVQVDDLLNRSLAALHNHPLTRKMFSNPSACSHLPSSTAAFFFHFAQPPQILCLAVQEERNGVSRDAYSMYDCWRWRRRSVSSSFMKKSVSSGFATLEQDRQCCKS